MRGFTAGSVVLLLGIGASAAAHAQAAPSSQIYTCTDSSGKKLISERPIPTCNDREQFVHNKDGSVKEVRRPTMTADERAEAEAKAQKAALELSQRQEAVRRDRNLLARFPNEAAHRKAREKALDDVNSALRISEARLDKLAKERKPLNDEAEFYPNKQLLPAKLKTQIDANDASVDAQRTLVQNQKQEAIRIDALYDAELVRLRQLWGGAQPGSLGLIAGSASAPSAKR